MRYIWTALVSALLFGASTPLSKLLLERLPPFGLAGCLYLGAALGVLPLILGPLAGPSAQPGPGTVRGLDRKNLACLCGAVLFGGILGPVAVLYGLALASSASVAMWLNLELGATAILGALVFRDHLGRAGWLGVAGTLAAALLLTWQEGETGPLALAFMAGAGLFWGVDNHLTALIDRLTPAQSTAVKGAVAGMVNLGISLWAEPLALDLSAMAAALAVGAVTYGLSICLYILSAQNLGATRSQMVFSAAPFFGVALSLVLVGESISLIQVLAGLVLALSLLVLFHDRHRHRHDHVPMAHRHPHTHDDGHHDHHGPSSPGVQETRDRPHSHWHSHGQETHSHPHWPDIHHRHPHGS